MRQLHASKEVGLRGTEARSNVLQGVRLHNLDYVNLASVSELRAFYLRIPGRGGGRRAAPLKDLRPPGPSGGCALPGCFDSAASIRESRSSSRLRGQAHGDHCLRYFPRIKRKWYARPGSADTNTVIKIRRSSLAFSLSTARASCRLTHLPVLGRSLSVSQQSGQARQLAYSAPLLGKPTAWLYPSAIPPHLRRGKPRRKCSGQPGYSASALLAQTVSGFRFAPPATDCAGTHASTVLR